MKERWPIPEAMRGAIIKTLGKILVDAESSPREKTAAARALMAADAQNIEMEKMQQSDEHEYRARLVAIAKHLGPSKIARLATDAGIAIDVESSASIGEREATPIDGTEASEGTRY